MNYNQSPCMTCALGVTAPHSEPIAAAHARDVFMQFKRHHPKSFCVHDMTGPKEENTTWFCVLGDSHFNKDNVKCPQWIPALSVSISDAINLNLNKKMHLLTLIMLFLAAIQVIGLFYQIYTSCKESGVEKVQANKESINQDIVGKRDAVIYLSN
jgi:hypothetical protein